MSMRCYVCNKKLNIFSDYTQIMVDGKKVEICTPCNRKREKEEIKQLLKTEDGKKEVSLRGVTLISTGILEMCIGLFSIIFLRSFLQLFAFILFGFGCYSVYKGISYKRKVRDRD